MPLSRTVTTLDLSLEPKATERLLRPPADHDAQWTYVLQASVRSELLGSSLRVRAADQQTCANISTA